MASASQTSSDTTGAERAATSSRLNSRHVATGLCVVAPALFVFAAFNDGGYFAGDYLLIGAVALTAAAVGLVAVGLSWRPGPLALTAIGSMLALAAWTGLSAAWSPNPAQAQLDAARTVGYVAAFLVAILAAADGRRAGLLLRLTVLALTGVCAMALLSRLRPELIVVDPGLLAVSQGRLAYPLGYWNALGADAAMTIMGCVGLAADARERTPLRAVYAFGGVLATCTLYLTISRGAGLALVAALAVVLAFSPRRWRIAASSVTIIGFGAIGVVALRAHPVLVDKPATIAQQSREGATVLGILLALAAAAAVAQLSLTRVRVLNASARRQWHGVQQSSAGFAILAGVVGLLFVGVYATSSDTLEGQAANGTTGLNSFITRQIDAFNDTAKPPPVGQARLATARSSRSEVYRVALTGVREHPLIGDGSGGYEVRWFRERRVAEDLRNAHSLELETASDLGIVGVLLLAGVLVPLVIGVSRVRHARGRFTRSQGAAAAGILVVWLVHSALDWDWQMASVTLPALCAGAVLLVSGSATRRHTAERKSDGLRTRRFQVSRPAAGSGRG